MRHAVEVLEPQPFSCSVQRGTTNMPVYMLPSNDSPRLNTVKLYKQHTVTHYQKNKAFCKRELIFTCIYTKKKKKKGVTSRGWEVPADST